MEISVTLRADSVGYITLECPFCGSDFKVRSEEFKNNRGIIHDLCCPYCGMIKAKNTFLTPEVMTQLKQIAVNYAIHEINKSRNGQTLTEQPTTEQPEPILIQSEDRPLQKVEISELRGKETTETKYMCPGCGRSVKVLYSADAEMGYYCPYCAEELSEKHREGSER